MNSCRYNLSSGRPRLPRSRMMLSTVSAFCIAHPSPSEHPDYLCPFALRPRLSRPPWQVVTPATTTGTPSPWGSRPFGDPAVRLRCTIEHDVGRPLIPLAALAGRCPTPWRLPGLTVHARAWRGRRFQASFRRCVTFTLGIGLQAIQPWPYRAGLAARRPERLRGAHRFPGMLCPLRFRVQVSRATQEPPPSSSHCVGDTTKRLAAHSVHEVLPHTAYRHPSPANMRDRPYSTFPARDTRPRRFPDMITCFMPLPRPRLPCRLESSSAIRSVV